MIAPFVQNCPYHYLSQVLLELAFAPRSEVPPAKTHAPNGAELTAHVINRAETSAMHVLAALIAHAAVGKAERLLCAQRAISHLRCSVSATNISKTAKAADADAMAAAALQIVSAAAAAALKEQDDHGAVDKPLVAALKVAVTSHTVKNRFFW